MNSQERVLNALLRKEVDRIPTFEWAIDKKVINSIAPGDSINEFIYKFDVDAIVVELDFRKESIAEDVFKDEWGNIIRFSKEERAISEGCIKSTEDLKKYNPPETVDEFRYKSLENALNMHSKEKAVILRLNDVLSIPRNLLGYENLFINLATNVELVKELVRLSVEINIGFAEEAVKRGTKIVFTGDDYAYDKGLLFSPQIFKEVFLPGFLEVIKGFKELGLIVIKHTDGNISSIIDDLVNSGIDCLDPLEETAGMNIAMVKQQYGKRIAVKGGIDCSMLLTFGSISDVINETKKQIKLCGPGNGYILSSSNSIHSGVKPDNYIAMLETLKEFGNYPMQ